MVFMARNTSHIPSTISRADHRFSLSPQVTIPRSKFDRSRGVKTTFNAGLVIPILVDEVLPGDTFSLNTFAVCRLATPIFPLMDNIYLDFHFFFVPNRLVWDNWEAFCGSQTDPTSTTDYLVPTVTSAAGGFLEGSLMDYMGLPTALPQGASAGTVTVNALHPRAYNLIWNEWYRDENIQDSVVVETDDGPDTLSNYVLLPRGKRKDYFTGCLPWPQKGPDVLLPLGTSAPIQINTALTSSTAALIRSDAFNGVSSPPLFPNINTFSSQYTSAAFSGNNGGGVLPAVYDPNGTLIANLDDATAATVNQIRQAFQTQRLYERDALGGTRYVEVLQSHFGVTSPDFRLQRPEYLGGGTVPMMVSPVPQTVPSGGVFPTPQGNLAAFGVAHASKVGFTHSFVEHGLLLGFVSARADLNYQSGIHRMWLRQTRLDYYWPVFAFLGEQEVLNQEIYAQGNLVIDPATSQPYDDEVFGYQERWAEYRYGVSLITGLFRSNASGSLDAWHLAQDFTSLPTLSPTFIEENPPMSRVQAIPTEPSFIMDCEFKVHCARPMPVYSVPGLIDHF